jgi:hypothetical protein
MKSKIQKREEAWRRQETFLRLYPNDNARLAAQPNMGKKERRKVEARVAKANRVEDVRIEKNLKGKK